MSLPTPNLDDRHFQDIVDEAKRLIPRFCPEWTDHNVSDPGVALIELFAWMTDMLLYRTNQVPDKMYIKFLELIGVQLEEPRPAQAPVTFYLSAPQPNDVIIPQETEVATARTENDPAVIFTTEQDLTIRPANAVGAYTRNASRTDAKKWDKHDLRELELPDKKIQIFPDTPSARDAFYLAFDADHSHHVLALVLACEEARGAGIDPRNPPVEWQALQGMKRWAPCEVESDTTGGFNHPGEIILRLPAMRQDTLPDNPQSPRAYWLRCRLTNAQSGDKRYRVSPNIEQLRAESRGGTVGARHAVTVRNETLGISEGVPGQEFRLLHQNVLSRVEESDHLIVDVPDAKEPERWHEVHDFADSRPEDHHYTLDSREGRITLGPELLQPDGSVYRFGAVPPKASVLRFSRYQYGGGIAGNVPAQALSVLMSSIPYVTRVANHRPAAGGRDAQSLDDAKLRAPHALRTRGRAVTADDYEYLASQIPGVARACCLGPGAQPGDAADPRPGEVLLLVVPEATRVTGHIRPEALALSADLRARVKDRLEACQPLGIALDVRHAQYVWISVHATLRLLESSDKGLGDEVRQRAEADLYRYLNPYVGGPQGQGWPFGRDLHVSEIYALLQRIPGVEFVDDLQIIVSEAGSAGGSPISAPRLPIARNALICSAQHQVTMS